jgi:hypothetical protein
VTNKRIAAHHDGNYPGGDDNCRNGARGNPIGRAHDDDDAVRTITPGDDGDHAMEWTKDRSNETGYDGGDSFISTGKSN